MAKAKSEATPSGAIKEKSAMAEVDMKHPAVDNTPRADAPEGSMKIDFNDPTKTDKEAVADNLSA